MRLVAPLLVLALSCGAARAQDAVVDEAFDAKIEAMVFSAGGRVTSLTDAQKAVFVGCVQDALDGTSDEQKQRLVMLAGEEANVFLDEIIETAGVSGSLEACVSG
jgi:hypothetical protein